jgi:hypothetical protein
MGGDYSVGSVNCGGVLLEVTVAFCHRGAEALSGETGKDNAEAQRRERNTETQRAQRRRA